MNDKAVCRTAPATPGLAMCEHITVIASIQTYKTIGAQWYIKV